MLDYRSKQLAELFHERTSALEMEQFQIIVYFNHQKYHILVFNKETVTPRRVIFAKANYNEIPSSICVFKEKSYIHEGKALQDFLDQISDIVVDEMIQSNGVYLLREHTSYERFDHLIDRYNRYLDLAKITKDQTYRKKAKRLKKLVDRIIFKKI